MNIIKNFKTLFKDLYPIELIYEFNNNKRYKSWIRHQISMLKD